MATPTDILKKTSSKKAGNEDKDDKKPKKNALLAFISKNKK